MNSATPDESLLYISRGYVRQYDQTHATDLRAVSPIAGDASGRQYLRLHFGDRAASLVLMLLKEGKGPIVGGRSNVNSNDSFVELARYFHSKGICVPKLIFDGRADNFLIVEDVGDQPLWRSAADANDTYFKQSIDLMR